MSYNSVIFREYDIRGVYETDFDLDFAFLLGKAFITHLCKKKNLRRPVVSVGHDARISSPAVSERLIAGMLACGADVKFLGLVTTPMSYFSIFVLPGLSGGIMVTGSHNPPEYNGFKVSVGSTTIHGAEIKELEKIIASGSYLKDTPGRAEHVDIFPTYLERYKKEFGKLTPIPIVLDCGNGAAGCIARELFEGVGLKPTILFEEPDGLFPNHHPDPTVEKNLVALKKKVLETKSVIGIGFDGDADRIGLVDEKGNMIYGDELLGFCAQFVLKDNPGKKIVGDVKCSDRLYKHIQKCNGVPLMWKSGHSLIKEKIKAEAAPFGGEFSGHVYFADRNYGIDDALYAGLRVVEILSQHKKTFSELFAFPQAFNTPEIRLDTTEEKKLLIVEAVTKAYPKSKFNVNDIDGIRVSFEDGWALVRASNTQPVIVFRAESSTAAGLEKIKIDFEKIITPLV